MILRQNWERDHRRTWPPINRDAVTLVPTDWPTEAPQPDDGRVFMTISVAPDEPDPPQHRWWAAARFVGEVALVLLIVALGWFAIVAFG